MWWLGAAFLAYCVLLGAGVFADGHWMLVNDAVWMLFPAAAAWWLWQGASMPERQDRCRSWKLLAVAQGCNAVGGVVYIARDAWLGWTDHAWLAGWIGAYYAATIAGVLCLSVPRRSRTDRMAFALDLALATVAAAALAWYLVVVPSARFATLGITDRLWNIFAVGGDAFAFFAISALAWRLGGWRGASATPEIGALWWTLAVTMAADLAFKHALFSSAGYVAGGPLDAVMSAGPVLAAATGLILRRGDGEPRAVPADYLGTIGRLAVPSALMVAGAVLPLGAEALDRRRPDILEPAVILAVLAVTLLVIRQAVAERALAVLDAERVQARQLEVVGRLAGSVAHDFNNLLTAVVGNASLLAEGRAGRDAEDAELLTGIQLAARRGKELTDRLQSFVQLRPPVPESLSLVRWATEARRLIVPLVPDRLLVQITAEPDTVAWVDRTHLNVLLVNLALNARDAVAGRGTLRVHASLTPTNQPPASGVPAGAWVRMDITDDGHGMTPAEMARATEPFYTTRAPGLGVGLGLVTVAAVVRAANGHVAFASTPGVGTTVSVFLPRAVAATRRRVVQPSVGDDNSTSTVPFSTA